MATMAIEGQLSSISPYESIRKVRDLMRRQNVSTREVILTVSSTDIIVMDGSSRVSGIVHHTAQLLYHRVGVNPT